MPTSFRPASLSRFDLGNARRAALLLLVLLACAANSLAQNRKLSLDLIYDPQQRLNFGGAPPDLRWLPDGRHYLQTERDRATGTTRLVRIDAATGTTSPFHDQAAAQAAFATLPNVTPANAQRLAAGDLFEFDEKGTRALLVYSGDLFSYDLETKRAARLTNNTVDESVVSFSPDGKRVAFVRNNDLYVIDLATNRERRLTMDGSAKIFNGHLNWVYQEELYGRGNFKSYWWSPDSTRIAFLRLDDAPVSEFAVVDHIPRLQEVETTPYPKAGDPNPLVRLGIIDIAQDSAANPAIRFVDLNRYKPNDLLISRVAWTPANQIVFQAQDRVQTFLDLNVADAANGSVRTLFREASRFATGDTVDSRKERAWVEAIEDPVYLRDGSFLWQSDRDGWRHLYHYRADGSLIRRLTKGDWEVRSFHGADEPDGFVYFTSTAHSHIAPQPYRVRLDGGGKPERLTQAEGSHTVQFNSDHSQFIARASRIGVPMQTRLHRADGPVVRTIDENPATILREFKLGKVEMMRVKTRDGFEMEAMMILPPDFDANKKYPVWSHTYAGPQAPTVRDAWGGSSELWHQYLAQQGYIIWICDNRSASGKGAAPAWTSARNFGEQELRDLEDGVKFLKSKPFVDPTRIGIWGWSFGGFMTSYALTHSDTFKVGIAGGSVTDWRLYDSIYTERYMGTPQTNPEGYARTAPLAAAKDLRGKLLLLHGTIDDNVHMQNTMQFAYELQRAGKPFQLMVYPRQRHGVTDPLLVKHMRQLMTDFIVNNL